MGSFVTTEQVTQLKIQADSTTNPIQPKKIDKDYEVQVIEICNTALAIKNKQHTINVQLSLRCEGLPAVKAFGSTDSMIVVLKRDQSEKKVQNQIEIGRTQIVANEVNPKYMKTFVFPFKRQTSEVLQFRIYHMLNSKTNDLKQQKLIGRVITNLYSLVDNEKEEQEIVQVSKSSSRAILKLNCSEYEGGNSYYEIGIELSNFICRSEVYFVIEAMKNGQAIPIVKSQTKKAGKFKQIKISCSKFQGQDNCGVQIKVYDVLKQEQIGCTKQFSIIDNTNDQKIQSHRVIHNGSFVGTVLINKWKKFTRDSFMSYIVGGARLHLLLAIDFTNSNNADGTSLHDLDENGDNVYINAIREIVGVLQYFSIQNQVALYGFGAKLPPFYKSVSQCFALNGNYFDPNVEGGVEEIIRLYKQNLQKIKMHGPTKISQVLDLAIKYASQQEIMSTKSSTYYVLLVITDGRINDFQDTINLLVKASTLPLSLFFVGVSNGEQENDKKNFSDLKRLDQETLILKCDKTGKTCQRDIVDFIKMSQFSKDHTKQALALETFAEIPNHFIDYMSSKNIKPLKQKKSLKAAKAEFIAQKIKSNTEKIQPFISSFLQKQKKQIKKKLSDLGFSEKDPLIDKMHIAMNDLSYFIEVYSQHKKPKIQQNDQRIQNINIRQVRKLQQYLNHKDQQKKTKTLQKLQKIQGNQYGRVPKTTKKPQSPPTHQSPHLHHPCLLCHSRQISIVHMECGHCSCCRDCYTARCPLCYHVNSWAKGLWYGADGELVDSESESGSQGQDSY